MNHSPTNYGKNHTNHVATLLERYYNLTKKSNLILATLKEINEGHTDFNLVEEFGA